MFPNKEIEDKVLEFSESEDKAGLDEYAKTFDIKLDRRKSFDNMVEQFAKQINEQENTNNGSTDEEPEVQENVEKDKNENTSESLDAEVSNEPKNDKRLSDGDMDSENESAQSTEQPKGSSEEPEEPELVDGFDSNFRPSFNLTFTDRRYGGEYANVGYWVIDDIHRNQVIERKWSKESIDACKNPKDVLTILYYIEKDGSCLVRESRNSRYYKFTRSHVKVVG